MSKNLPKVIEDYRRLLQRDPNSKAFAPLAEALRENGELTDAEIVAANGIRRHPEYVGGYVALGRILMEQKRHPEAAPILHKAHQLDPQNLQALQLLGSLHLQNQQPKEALKAFKRILFLNPQSEKARNAVQKLESLTADEFEEDIFQYQVLKPDSGSSLPSPSGPPLGSGSRNTPSNPTADLKVASADLDRKLSLVDALIVRNDLARAQEILTQLNQQYQQHKEISRRFELLEASLPEEEATPLQPLASREKQVFERKRRLLENLLRRIKADREDFIIETSRS